MRRKRERGRQKYIETHRDRQTEDRVTETEWGDKDTERKTKEGDKDRWGGGTRIFTWEV